jgi:hypothetical protein
LARCHVSVYVFLRNSFSWYWKRDLFSISIILYSAESRIKEKQIGNSATIVLIAKTIPYGYCTYSGKELPKGSFSAAHFVVHK